MPTRKRLATTDGYSKSPEAYGDALANIGVEAEKDMILGQAWLCGKNQLVTCGHVVEDYVDKVHELVVKFPASANRYRVQAVKLHPSFVRQKDQLVKFDVAVLEVELHSPESESTPLPISYEKPLKVNQSAYAVRYPAHLGMITATPSPLAQRGHFLGTLRKHDPFHLLHDLALSTGDSGAPILDGRSVVAIHCGDTASLPGLNLPTSSIRLALWVDALRELGIKPTVASENFNSRAILRNWSAYVGILLAFFISFFLSTGLILFAATALDINRNQWKIDKPPLAPMQLSIAKIGDEPGNPQMIKLRFNSATDARVFILPTDGKNILFDYPVPQSIDLKAKQDSILEIPTVAQSTQAPGRKEIVKSICLIAIDPQSKFGPRENLAGSDNSASISEALDRLHTLEAAQPGRGFHQLVEW
ncbi:MAG: hypothetical protein C5B53_02780 [Candidatus Melainabacteria bacterium]|nr:MAG: hypothetical protein C5B53_02780 [Candidatus Melainabacteria bacterium]